MKSMGYIFVVLLFVSCKAVKVHTDYQKDTDFSNYTTYNYYDNLETGLSELDEKRLISALDVQLQQKGLLLSEEPDFLINIVGGSYTAPKNNSVGVGLGGSGRSLGGGVSVGIPIGKAKVQRELVFDFVDVQKDELFWQATSNSSFNENRKPEEREEKLQEVVLEVLRQYPPKNWK